MILCIGTHGKECFDENNIEHLNVLNKGKNKAKEINSQGKAKNFYLNACYTGSVLDVKKRKYALERNIKRLEFFSVAEFLNGFKDAV